LYQWFVNPLSQSAIVPNKAGLKTRFPVGVGHDLADVVQQLSKQLEWPGHPSINSPEGFAANFLLRIGSSGLKRDDVLGYYNESDLPMYRFLAENYTYCERYFSSHPGPTLPNRMYSLAGDVQYDRVGEAILDNNNADNFRVSRALSIFDLLTRKNISWRVYESFPSVTMLRFFARYAADGTNIEGIGIDQLEKDIAFGDLKSVTFIDPAMHSAPENDDHPPFADMLSGQIFIKRIYDALRSNEALWRKTLLIITYDEHGGFYDHVIPPVADALAIPGATGTFKAE
jgi:phospholipase C